MGSPFVFCLFVMLVLYAILPGAEAITMAHSVLFLRFRMFWDVGWNNVALRQICLSPEPVLEPSVAAEEPRPLYALEGCEGCAQSGSSFVHSAISLPLARKRGQNRAELLFCELGMIKSPWTRIDWVFEFIGLGREEPCCWFQLFDATL